MRGRDDELKAASPSEPRLARTPAAVRACLEPAGEAVAEGIAALRSAANEPSRSLPPIAPCAIRARRTGDLFPGSILRPISQSSSSRRRATMPTCRRRSPPSIRRRKKVGVMHARRPPGTRGGFCTMCQKPTTKAAPIHWSSRASRQRKRRRLPVELAARGAHAWLHRAGADGNRLDLVVDGPGFRRPQHRPHGRQVAGSGTSMRPAAPDRHGDGGTFSYVLGLRGGCRFTHVAPVAAPSIP